MTDAAEQVNGSTPGNPLPQAALGLARLGWPVMPVYHVMADGACACGRQDCGRSAGKHPRVSRWPEAASARSTDPPMRPIPITATSTPVTFAHVRASSVRVGATGRNLVTFSPFRHWLSRLGGVTLPS